MYDANEQRDLARMDWRVTCQFLRLYEPRTIKVCSPQAIRKRSNDGTLVLSEIYKVW